MDFATIVLLVAAVLVLGYSIAIYNGLITVKHNVRNAWSNIDVVLKQRHDELPKLVAVCKQYMQHEQGTLERVTAARAAVYAANQRGDVAAVGASETDLRRTVGKLIALAESYPDLKADKQFGFLRERISTLENTIADRREYYNESVTLNNIRIEVFPDVLIARLFSFKPQRQLEFQQSELADVDLKALFN
jgi:LemA protein